MNIVLFMRIFAFCFLCILSFYVHFLLFNNIKNTYIDTILTYPSLHILYFLISLLISEHLLNYIQRRKSKQDKK
jgi:hypothetical protein